jgi:manganese-dependent inorganic pyrophosphatase
MDAAVYVVGHRHPDTDSIGSAIAYARLKNALGDARVRPARAGEPNAETRWVLERFGLPLPELLTRATGLQLILVDHNEVAQALEDVEHATILEIWEHHRLGDLDLPQPILFHCEPVGATATLVAEQYLFHGVTPPPDVAALLLAAILSDTLGFASPTTSEKDRETARRLEAIAGVDAAALGRELLAARGDVSARSATDLVEADFKEFELAGQRIGIGQIETLDAAPLLPRKAEFVAELRRVRAQRRLVQVMLMVTDIGKQGSHLWFAGERRDVLERALGRSLVDDATWLEGCMSRKKQVVPPLERAFVAAAASARE